MDANLIDQLLPPFIFGVFTVAFFAIHFYERENKPALILSLSYLAATIAFGFEAAYDLFNHGQPIPFLADALCTLAPALMLVAVAKRHNLRVPLMWVVAVVVATTLAQGWFRFVEEDMVSRVQALTVGAVVIYLTLAGLLLHHVNSRLARLLAGQLIVMVAGLGVTVAMMFDPTYAAMGEVELRHSVYASILNLVLACLSLSMAVTILVDFLTTLVGRLNALAETDSLTDLVNRRGMERRIAQLKADETFSGGMILVGDIDHFKTLNDTYGHMRGDIALKFVASILSEGARDHDVIARVGGEEFCIVFLGAGPEIARLSARNLCLNIEINSRDAIGLKQPMTISFGGAHWAAGSDFWAAYGAADRALYRAKAAGRNEVALESDLPPRKLSLVASNG